MDQKKGAQMQAEHSRQSDADLRPPYILSVILIALGGWLAFRGHSLVTLGGSPYYLLAGLALLICGALAFRGAAGAARGYAVFLGITVTWAIWESGLDGWALAPRLILPLALGLWFALPSTSRRLGSGLVAIKPVLLAGLFCILTGLGLNAVLGEARPDPIHQAGSARGAIASMRAQSSQGAVPGDWLNYGNDPGGKRFSQLSQITPDNADQLQVAWTYPLGPTPTGAPDKFEATPIKVGETLYFCTPASDVVALDAETGKPRWLHRSGTKLGGSTAFGACRGVAWHAVSGSKGPCSQRIYAGTLDARLIALDAGNGMPCADFGRGGAVNLLDGLGNAGIGYYFVTSAPTVIDGKLVVGGWVLDGQYVGEPSGVIRAFDAVSGKLAWAFDMGRPDRQGAPVQGETYTHSTPNSWAPMSADPELGLVYVPLGNPIPDYTGTARRPFDEEYGSSLVALDVKTGKPRWKFQTTRHDLWDYDVPAQPTLVDIPTVQGMRKAVIQPTKRGEMFVLDRVSGEPIFPVSDHRVPTHGAIAGERISPTQPFSDAMPSFRGPDLTEGQMWGLTPIDQLECRIAFRSSRYDGTMTPPGHVRAISSPGFLGGVDWGGVAVDPERHVMIVNSNRMANTVRLVPRKEADKVGVKPFVGEFLIPASMAKLAGILAQGGTPAAAEFGAFLSPIEAPCQQPPWGNVSAVDLRSGKLVWSHRLGTARDSGPWGVPSGIPLKIGVPSLGGTVITRGGVFFLSGTQDHYLRAFDLSTGRVVWRARLPSGGQATPMTYLSKKSGRQFVAVAAGGHQISLGSSEDYVIAYALPNSKGN